MDLTNAPKEDVIDAALIDLIDEIIGKEGTEEDFDAASDVVFEIIEEMVGAQELAEIPDNDAEDESKQEWLKRYYAILRQAVQEGLHDGFMGEPEDSSSEISI
jgi:hypothetical protein